MKRLYYWFRPSKARRRKIKMWFRTVRYGIVDVGQTVPVHNYFGFKMRANWKQAHHLWWGLVLMALTGYWTQSDTLWVFCVAYPLFSLGLYVALDDIYQHHKQVKHPEYHSPVHNWYVKLLDNDNSRIIRLIRKINEWLDGR